MDLRERGAVKDIGHGVEESGTVCGRVVERLRDKAGCEDIGSTDGLDDMGC